MSKPQKADDADFLEWANLEIFNKQSVQPKTFQEMTSVKEIDRKINPTLFLIGGGEIGVEIGLAARQASPEWVVRGVVDANEREPINNLPFYVNDVFPRPSEDYVTSAKEQKNMDPFLCLPHERPYQIDLLVNDICIYEPDVVVLEDPFLDLPDWANLQNQVQKRMKNKSPLFVPSPVEKIPSCGNIAQCDVFLNKKKMKDFLSKLGYTQHLLGTSERCINIDKLREELDTTKANEYRVVKKAFEAFKGPVLFKPAQTSSGHGQFKVSKIEDLTSDLINKQLDLYRKSKRVFNNQYLLERYVENKLETCIIRAATEVTSTVLSKIYYKKYGEEEDLDDRYKGMSRLAWSLTAPGQTEYWQLLLNVVEKISKYLKVPFLYVEFIIDLDNKEYYINEVSYRPDDAGFITSLSNEKDQFSLFVESLDCMRRGVHQGTASLLPRYDEPKSYLCETLIPVKKIDFEKIRYLRLNYDISPRGAVEENNSRLKIYEKTLDIDKDERVMHGRVIGYIWHRKTEDGRTLLTKLIKDSDMIPDAGPDAVQRLIDTLPEKARDLDKAFAFAHEES